MLPRRRISSIYLCPEIAFLQILRAFFLRVAQMGTALKHRTQITIGRKTWEELPYEVPPKGALLQLSSSSFSTAMNASVGICTVPRERIFFLPSFCFSSSFFFRVMSPP